MFIIQYSLKKAEKPEWKEIHCVNFAQALEKYKAFCEDEKTWAVRFTNVLDVHFKENQAKEN